MKAVLRRFVRIILGPPDPPVEARPAEDDLDIELYLYAPMSIPQLF